MQQKNSSQNPRFFSIYGWALLVLLTIFLAACYVIIPASGGGGVSQGIMPLNPTKAPTKILPTPIISKTTKPAAMLISTQAPAAQTTPEQAAAAPTNEPIAATPVTANGSAPQNGTGAQEAAKVGSKAPNFTLKTLDGKDVSLADFAGKPVYLVFFASWCPHCQAEAPIIKKLYDQYKDQGLNILAVNITFQDVESDVTSFANSHGWTFPVVLDSTGKVSAKYKLKSVPGNYFIDSQGIISYIAQGELDGGTIAEEVRQIMQ